MTVVRGLIWDDWNRQHVAQHHVTPEEVEEVCHGQHQEIQSYRNRVQLSGKTKNKRKLTVILSPENRNFRRYESGIYYPITAFDENEEN